MIKNDCKYVRGNGLGYKQIPNILKVMSIVTDDIHNDNAYMILKKKIVARGFNDSDFKCRLK